jgi:hypothetical protein
MSGAWLGSGSRAALVLLLVALGSACSVSVTSDPPQIAEGRLQQSVSDALTKQVGQRPERVDCPGPIAAKAGTTTRCVLSDNGVRYGMTVKVRSVKDGRYNLDIQVDQQQMR